VSEREREKMENKCQFHQHFLRAFFADILAPKITKLSEALSNEISAPETGESKLHRKMLTSTTKI